ncbi:hypothetical protein [Nonomuraea salmonea]|uniref:hypothetical protein n=1 Tax=Nonomuraea salmonea TaxID=46181 RepID=UPI003CD09E24
MGTAYAVWTGVGAAGTAILGMIAMGGRGVTRAADLHRPDPGRRHRAANTGLTSSVVLDWVAS